MSDESVQDPAEEPADGVALAWRSLCTRAGRFEGTGINHEQEPFTGRLEISGLADRDAIRLHYEATGVDGTLFHGEETLIEYEDTGLMLGTTSTNHEGLHRYDVRAAPPVAEGVSLVFGLGARDDTTSFRGEIALRLHNDGAVTYAHAWGLPGGPFDDRSAARMQPVNDRR